MALFKTSICESVTGVNNTGSIVSYDELKDYLCESLNNINTDMANLYISDVLESYGIPVEEGIVSSVGEFIKKAIEFIKELIKKVLGWIKGLFNSIGDFFRSAKQWVNTNKATILANAKKAAVSESYTSLLEDAGKTYAVRYYNLFELESDDHKSFYNFDRRVRNRFEKEVRTSDNLTVSNVIDRSTKLVRENFEGVGNMDITDSSSLIDIAHECCKYKEDEIQQRSLVKYVELYIKQIDENEKVVNTYKSNVKDIKANLEDYIKEFEEIERSQDLTKVVKGVGEISIQKYVGLGQSLANTAANHTISAINTMIKGCQSSTKYMMGFLKQFAK